MNAAPQSASIVAAISLGTLQLTGCALYPTSRTFYEPTATQGTRRNRTACGYLHMHDTAERKIGDITLTVTVGSEKEPEARHPTLDITLVLEGPSDSWKLSTESVLLVLNAPPATVHPSSSAYQSGPGAASNRQFERWTLTYPAPAGISDTVEVSFEPGALAEHGRPIDVGPLRFNRVKKADVYFGSINC